MRFGTLEFGPALDAPDLLAPPTLATLQATDAAAADVLVADIDPGLADTAAFCEQEYGGITPIGLPADWSILVDETVATHERLIVGSGIRGSKLLVPGPFLAGLPRAEVLSLAQA
ncbi:YbaK/EbsC family protein [Agromyces kandeliae]|uniref:YbaK/aminoacyl-tRNA synthetase-associated domain-containing protein n=1 Tax=Agromyces kandeliae TaxID=2666141 RepID=A0A6L5R1P3_9MICO|nr:YbaK/EbsC family protein [Agromyces kandeliae]MRX43815.1 hypothetical protein [Agromyces kandeliae]